MAADSFFCSFPPSDNASAFHHYTTHNQCFVSNAVQPSLVSQVDYDSSTRCSLPPLTPLRDSFDKVSRQDIGSLYDSKIEPENSWEYNSLHLSPDAIRTADKPFGEVEEFWNTGDTMNEKNRSENNIDACSFQVVLSFQTLRPAPEYRAGEVV